jgi:transposase
VAKEEERKLAEHYFVYLGKSQLDIAKLVKTSTQSVNRWAREDEWENKRAARLSGRSEIAGYLKQQLLHISEANAKHAEAGTFTPAMADAQLKIAQSIEALSEELPLHIQVQVLDGFLEHLPKNNKSLLADVAGHMASYLTKIAKSK